MTNAAFEEACKKVGGQTSMARLLKTSQANVWSWLNKTKHGLPAEVVLQVEELSGVPRFRLRPDIYPERLFSSAESASGESRAVG